jgi:lysyl endopeptidase
MSGKPGKHLRWLAFTAVLVLAACGGADETAQSAQSKSASSTTATEAPSEATAEPGSFNSANSVTQPAEAAAQATPGPFTSVPLDTTSARKAGASIDLGAPTAADLEKRNKNNRKSATAFGGAKAHQIGFARPVAATSNRKSFQELLTWSTTATGTQRAELRMSSTGAKTIRLGLLIQNLPDDLTLRVYAEGSSKAQQTTGVHINAAIRANVKADGDSAAARTYWMPTTMGEATVLEVELPAGRDTAGVDFTLPSITHGVETAMEADLSQIQAKTECANLNPDATCTLPPAVNAVSSMDFVDAGIPYTCTGTLVANRGVTQQGYLLTANHCIGTQTIASTLTTYWFYRSTACNSTTINPNWTFRAGGATLLFNRSEVSGSLSNPTGTDTSFLDLPYEPPAGTMYAGWQFLRHGINTGTVYTALHHPGGDFMRRSDGRLTNYFNYIGNDLGAINANASYPMYEVQWNSGITEGGSSGSALFHEGTTSNPQIIGQLWGGFSACNNPTGKDYYGRFDIAYENGLINWLNPGYRMVFRFYNTYNGTHFFSASVDERDNVRATNTRLTYEAPVFMVAPAAGSGLNPVHRFVNRLTGTHFYTISESEKNSVIANLSNVYTYEGIAWYARQAGAPTGDTVEVYRFFRKSAGTHLYTTSAAERDNIINTLGQYYNYEGVAYLAWPMN